MSDLPTEDDLAAKDELDTATEAAASTAATAAEKWLQAVAALTGLLTTVAVVKGPTESAELADGVQVPVVAGMVVGFVALAAATWLLYSAAYGRPGAVTRIRTSPVAGLAGRLAGARDGMAKDVLRRTRSGMLAAGVGVLALFAAGLLTLLPQDAGAAGGDDTVCVSVNGSPVLTLSGTSLDVVESAEGVTVGGC